MLAANKNVFEAEKLDKAACKKAADAMIAAVEASIDRLEVHKDSIAYVFGSCMRADLNSVFCSASKSTAIEGRTFQDGVLPAFTNLSYFFCCLACFFAATVLLMYSEAVCVQI
mgnify:CR=1 FL=1